VPAEYSNLPQLKGRATVVMETDRGKITLVADGYSAMPVIALISSSEAYDDGLEFTRVEEFYVVQASDPPGADDGFVDPATVSTGQFPKFS